MALLTPNLLISPLDDLSFALAAKLRLDLPSVTVVSPHFLACRQLTRLAPRPSQAPPLTRCNLPWSLKSGGARDSRYIEERNGQDRWPDLRCYGHAQAIVEASVIHPTAPLYTALPPPARCCCTSAAGEAKEAPKAKGLGVGAAVLLCPRELGGMSEEAISFINHLRTSALILPPSIHLRNSIPSTLNRAIRLLAKGP